MSEQEQLERLRQEYYREKHSTVFVFFFLTVIVILLVSSFFMLSSLFATKQSSKTSLVQNNYAMPCLDENTKAISASDISLRVLNGSGKSGLANAVGGALQLRGFQIVESANAPLMTQDTQIHYGENAIRQAYTLAGNFENSTMIMDDRKDGLIDVIIGSSFVDLIESEMVTTSNVTDVLVSPNKCEEKGKIKKQAALEHDEKKVPAYKAEKSEELGQADSEQSSDDSNNPIEQNGSN
jgi:hypothetical protein